LIENQIENFARSTEDPFHKILYGYKNGLTEACPYSCPGKLTLIIRNMKIIRRLDISGNASSTSVIEFLRAISLGGSPSSPFGIYYSIDKRRVLTNLPRVAGASKRVIYIKDAIKEIGRPRGASTACASDLGSENRRSKTPE